MQKRTFKSLIAMLGVLTLLSYEASASMLGFGKKASWGDSIKAEIAKVKDMPNILSMNPDTDQKNDGNVSCSPRFTNCSSVDGFASMVKAGCMPRVSQHTSIQTCKVNFCLNRCASKDCSAGDPEDLKKLCGLHCGEAYLKTGAAQDRLKTCFDKWQLPKPDDYMERLGDWSRKDTASWPLTLDQARDFVASTQDSKEEAAETIKQSSGFINEYKAGYVKTVRQYAKLLEQQDKAHKEMSKLLEMYRAFKADLANTRAKKEEGVNNEKIKPDVFDTVESAAISGKLPSGHKDKTLSLPVAEKDLDKLIAEIVADFKLTLGTDLDKVVKSAKDAVGSEQFKAAGKKVLRLVNVRKQLVSKEAADEVAEEAAEEDGDAAEAPAKKGLLDRARSLGQKRKRS